MPPTPTPAARACGKCGGADLYVRYVKANGDRWHLPRSSEMCPERQEHLHWRCRTCDYDWTGPARDATRPTPEG